MKTMLLVIMLVFISTTYAYSDIKPGWNAGLNYEIEGGKAVNIRSADPPVSIKESFKNVCNIPKELYKEYKEYTRREINRKVNEVLDHGYYTKDGKELIEDEEVEEINYNRDYTVRYYWDDAYKSKTNTETLRQVQGREAWIDPEMLGKEEYNYDNMHANLEPTGYERYLLDRKKEEIERRIVEIEASSSFNKLGNKVEVILGSEVDVQPSVRSELDKIVSDRQASLVKLLNNNKE